MTQGKRFAMKAAGAGRDFYALRLEQRFIRALETLARQPDTSVEGTRKPGRSSGLTSAAMYRMRGNEAVDREAMRKAHREATIGRLA